MVLDRQNHHLHAGCFHGLAPLVCVEFFQVEDFRVFLSASPFQAGKTVRPEMDEGDKLVLQCRQLVGRRHDMGRFRPTSWRHCETSYHLHPFRGRTVLPAWNGEAERKTRKSST